MRNHENRGISRTKTSRSRGTNPKVSKAQRKNRGNVNHEKHEKHESDTEMEQIKIQVSECFAFRAKHSLTPFFVFFRVLDIFRAFRAFRG